MEFKRVGSMLRQIILLWVFCGAVFSLSAQNQRVSYSSSDKKAIKCYEEALDAYNYRNLPMALEKLEASLSRDQNFLESYVLMAQIHAELNQENLAIIDLEKVVKINPRFYPPTWYFLAALYLDAARYEEALEAFETYVRFGESNEDLTQRSDLGQRSCVFAIDALAHPVPFSPLNLGENVNTEFPEYYPSLTADGQTLLFTRQIPDTRALQGRHEDFFISRFEDGEWMPAFNLTAVNTINNEGAPSLSADGQYLIFTACEGIDGDWGEGRYGKGSCDLFFSQRIGDSWSKSQNLSALNTGHWESQPSFSADGRTIYFIRGIRSGGQLKDQDIWYASINESGGWSTPERIPGMVNTPYAEESVMIHPDGKTLYFSSNGHPGMGGLDIFVSRKRADGTWGTPQNLGYPINTHNDENSLLVSADGNLAYFASDREGGFGDLDLYSFPLYEGVKPGRVTYVSGEVYDDKSFKKLEAKFELIDLESGETVVSAYSDALKGTFLVALAADRDYALYVSREGYIFHSENFSLKNHEDVMPYQLDIPMKKLREGNAIVLQNLFFDTDKYNLKEASKVELDKLTAFMEKHPSMVIEIRGHTDNVGSQERNQLLSEQRAGAVVEYLVSAGIDKTRLLAVGMGETEPVASNDEEAGRRANRRIDFKIKSL